MDASQTWAEYCEATGTNPSAPHDVWKFCDGGPAADELADLVFLGRKTATSSALVSFGPDEEIPAAGSLSVICRDSGEAALVIRDTHVSIVPFDEVPASHAFKEGEGSRTLEEWREIHRRAFTPDYERLGLPFDEHGDCVLEEFELVFPLG